MNSNALRTGFLPILAACALASPARAYEATNVPLDRGATLQVEDAIYESLLANRDLQTATYEIERARGRLVQAGLWPNPTLTAFGNDDSAFSNSGEYSVNAGFEQRFSVVGRISRAKDVARVDVAAAIAEVRDVARRVIGQVQTAFFDLLALNAQIAERDHLIDTVARLVSVSQARAKLAEVSALDVTTARIELQRLQMERDLLLAERGARSAELNRLLGRAPQEALTIRGDLLPTSAEPSQTESILSEALKRRPDLQQAILESDRAGAEVRLAKAERWEDWTIGFGYDRDRQVLDGGPPQDSDQLLGLRLTVPLPLWDRNQGRIAEAQSAEAQTHSRSGALQLSIATEIAAASGRLQNLRRVVDEYKETLIPLADGNVVVAQSAYRSGLANVQQVVQAQRQQGELRIGYVDVLAKYRQTHVDLEVASATSPQLETFGGNQ